MSEMNGKSLPPSKLREALAAVMNGRINPGAPVTCPVCGERGLHVDDRSVRPHAEWYALSCASCGLDDTIHIPMGSRPGSFS
jgi:hypothetical protein